MGRNYRFFLLIAVVTIAGVCAWRLVHGSRRLGAGVIASEGSANGHSFTVVRVDLREASPDLYWQSPNKQAFRTFDRLSAELSQSQSHLLFAANAGIFDPGFKPTGLHVENGRELVSINLRSGLGNFYMKPNGVFFVDSHGARIVESPQYPGTSADVRLATQSGPLLVIDGRINPAFHADSNNAQIRSGIGLASANEVVFVLSNDPVTFYQFASYFRDKLGCHSALYLDGAISRFFPFKSPAAGVPGDIAGILAISQNAGRLPAGHSPGPATTALK